MNFGRDSAGLGGRRGWGSSSWEGLGGATQDRLPQGRINNEEEEEEGSASVERDSASVKQAVGQGSGQVVEQQGSEQASKTGIYAATIVGKIIRNTHSVLPARKVLKFTENLEAQHQAMRAQLQSKQ